jgi:Protein of unknown function (DUF3800)
MTGSENKKDIWIFVDETGTSSLDNHATPIFGLGFFVCEYPSIFTKIVSEIKYKLWKIAPNKNDIIEYFHATDNPRIVRDAFYLHLKSYQDIKPVYNFNYIKKDYLYNHYLLGYDGRINNDSFKKLCKEDWMVNIYTFFILAFLTSNQNNFKNCRINLVLSRLFSKKTETEIVDVIKKITSNEVNLFFVDNKTDSCCQLADYFSWTVNRKITRNEDVGYSYLESLPSFKINDITKDYVDILQKISLQKTIEILNKIQENTKKNSSSMDSSFR